MAATELENRVNRAVEAAEGSDKERRLREQVKWLADRLALALSFLADWELNEEFERDKGEDNRVSEAIHTIMSEGWSWQKLREERRKFVFYGQEKARVREFLKSELGKGAGG